ncbi:unnamed protein product [Ectocarpus sp. 8 AP-2014]
MRGENRKQNALLATPFRTIDSSRRILLDCRKTSKTAPFPHGVKLLVLSLASIWAPITKHLTPGAPHGKRKMYVNHAKTTW